MQERNVPEQNVCPRLCLTLAVLLLVEHMLITVKPATKKKSVTNLYFLSKSNAIASFPVKYLLMKGSFRGFRGSNQDHQYNQ